MASKAALATVSFYLADELSVHNIAVNTMIPGHTRGSWFDDTIRARIAAGAGPGRRPVRPEHVTPLAVFLASQDASGVTGTMFDVMEWNREHGCGTYEDWAERSFPPDLEEAFTRAGA
jgi:NAD(P)-dependent dehydrogenase (short-subunit alcohol dehydrogenase family)